MRTDPYIELCVIVYLLYIYICVVQCRLFVLIVTVAAAAVAFAFALALPYALAVLHRLHLIRVFLCCCCRRPRCCCCCGNASAVCEGSAMRFPPRVCPTAVSMCFASTQKCHFHLMNSLIISPPAQNKRAKGNE